MATSRLPLSSQLDCKEKQRIFDLSLIQKSNNSSRVEDESCTIERRRHPLSPQTHSVPALDSVTVYDTVGDDDSSISTIGSAMSYSSATQRRSMFSKYWKATDHSSSLSNVRKTRPNSCSPTISAPPPRRSIIFGSVHRSTPYLPVNVSSCNERSLSPLSLGKKSASASELGRQAKGPLTPCLRRDPLYSGDHAQRCSRKVSWDNGDDTQSVSSSVRFDLDVTVRHFEPPQEYHAEEGWVDYFQ